MVNVTPIRRRLDLRAVSPTGSGPELLFASFVDVSDIDRVEASSICELTSPNFYSQGQPLSTLPIELMYDAQGYS